MIYIKLEKTDFEVLSFLIANIPGEYSIMELSQKLNRPYVKVHNSIKRLSKKKIIKEELKGKAHYCSINYRENTDVACFINSQKSRDFLDKNKKISLIINEIIKSIKFPNYSLVLFGSYGKGKADKHSDVDIAIITSNENKEEAERVTNSIKKISSLDIHSLEFTYSDFIEMLKSKEMNVGKEIVKNYIIFKGCEQFYDCMKLTE